MIDPASAAAREERRMAAAEERDRQIQEHMARYLSLGWGEDAAYSRALQHVTRYEVGGDT